MAQTSDAAGRLPDEPATRAEELRDLAGPVSGWDETEGRHVAADEDRPEAPADDPDALTDPSLDEVRAAEDPGAVEDEYGLRSMPAQPNPTADDPGSQLNY